MPKLGADETGDEAVDVGELGRGLEVGGARDDGEPAELLLQHGHPRAHPCDDGVWPRRGGSGPGCRHRTFADRSLNGKNKKIIY